MGGSLVRRTLVLHTRDNVAAALQDLRRGEAVQVHVPDGATLTVLVRQDIPLGHKFALCDVCAGDDIIKHGVSIGSATQNIATGDHVHVHNLE